MQTLGVDFLNSLAVALDGCSSYVLQFLTLFAAESVPVLSKVLIVQSECAQSLGVGRQQVVDAFEPVGLGIVSLHVPSVVSNAIERDFGSLGMFHWVRHKSRHVVGNVLAVAVGRTEQDVVSDEVAHGEVPPDVSLAVDAAVDPLHRFLVDTMHYGVARPHYAYVLVHLSAECAQIALLVVSPSTVVFGRTHNKR